MEPTWMYKRGQFGRTESRLFNDPSEVPEGWVDSPAKVDAEAPKKPAKKPTRKKKAKPDAE